MSTDSNTYEELEVNELVTRMTALNSLNDWGMLVAYRLSTLNACLAARHDSLKEAGKTTVEPFKEDLIDGAKTINVTYNIQLGGAPTMEFLGAAGAVQMRFSLSGTYTLESEQAETIGDDLFVTVQAMLTTVSGRAGETVVSSTKLGTVCAMENGSDQVYHTAIDLAEPLVRVTNKEGKLNNTLGPMARGLTRHFRAVGLDYRLATVNQPNAASAGGTTLKPSKFVLTIFGGDDPAASQAGVEKALLMWIAIEGINHGGKEPSAESPLAFARKPGKDKKFISPIPKNHNASVIISREVLGHVFIKHQLEQLGFTDVNFVEVHTDDKSDQKDIKTGIRFTARPPSKIIKIDGFEENNGKFDGFSFDMNSSAAKFFLDKGSSNWAMEYTVKDVIFRWETYIATDGGPYRTEDKGSVTYTFNASANGAWGSGTTTESLNVKYDAPKSFAITYKTKEYAWYEMMFAGKTDYMLKGMEKLTADVPAVSVNLGALDFWLETSLLFPGTHSFKLGSIPDTLYIPRDMFLPGNFS
ncbi:hypothetical protein V8C37DRAFT_388467 [Trichoderma ceciliae]